MTFPPGPRGVIEVSQAFRAFSANPAKQMLALSEKYNGTAAFTLGRENVVFLGEPELIGEVLLDKDGVFIKDKVTRGLSIIVGQGLLTSEGELWKRQRKLISPSLTRKHIATYADAMVRSARQYAAKIRDNEVRDVHVDMAKVTLEIVLETLFGTGLDRGHEHVGEVIDDLMADFQEVIQSWRRLFPEWVPFAARRRSLRNGKELDRVVMDLVRKRRASGALGDDLLSRLLAARDESDPTRGMDDQQLRDELITLFLAGHETTANALSWTLLLLAEHPHVDAKVRAEVEAKIGGRAATLEDMSALPYTDAVLKESMRIYPPAHIIGREATREIKLGSWTIPANASVLISPWALHHDRRFFDDPEAFRPERWLDGSTANLPRHVYLPFGGGPRICVGNHFAIMEAVLTLASVVQRVRFERVDREAVDVQPAITLRPKHGIALRAKVRAVADSPVASA